MGIDLRRRDVCVAEKLLHHPQIRAIVQEMTRESMPQHMRADAGGTYPRRRAGSLEIAREGLAGNVAAAAVRGKEPRARGLAGMGLIKIGAKRGNRAPRFWGQ